MALHQPKMNLAGVVAPGPEDIEPKMLEFPATPSKFEGLQV
jgi:hypothetical protein